MTARDVPFAALLPPKENPRTTYDEASIAGLAQTIAKDGVIQNLVVRSEGKDRFRVIIGKRRYLALKYLREAGTIDDDYLVPVSVRKKLPQRDADRMSTVENVQRESMHPIDEADAFAKLLQDGAEIPDVAVETGVSVATIRRRLALASLSDEAKAAAKEGVISLSIAEALTLGSAEQQRDWIKEIVSGAEVDAEDIRGELLSGKPTVALAAFPLERYTGTLSKDLFADEESTYFDDVEQFVALQRQVAEELVEQHRQAGTSVELLEGYNPPWWHYRLAAENETGSVVIHLAPNGLLEVRESLVKHEVAPQVVAATQATPLVRKVRNGRDGPSGATIRNVALHQSVMVQAALFEDVRKAKETTAALLLLGHGGNYGARLTLHEALDSLAADAPASPAYMAIEKLAAGFVERLPEVATRSNKNAPAWQRLFRSITNAETVYAAVCRLDDDELDALILLCAVLCIGRSNLDMPEASTSLLACVARRLNVDLRRYWRPDTAFLLTLRREELETAAIESGASIQLPKLKSMNKRELVAALDRYFERTANPDAVLDEHDAKGRTWLPACMALVAAKTEHVDCAA
jgi:ParB family transcriptional regulator, chromosome partitioning protein